MQVFEAVDQDQSSGKKTAINRVLYLSRFTAGRGSRVHALDVGSRVVHRCQAVAWRCYTDDAPRVNLNMCFTLRISQFPVRARIEPRAECSIVHAKGKTTSEAVGPGGGHWCAFQGCGK